MKCDICNNLAECKITWGTIKNQQGILCNDCKDTLWQKVKGNVSLGINIWIQEELEQYIE